MPGRRQPSASAGNPAPPVLDYPAPGTIQATASPLRPAPAAPPLQYPAPGTLPAAPPRSTVQPAASRSSGMNTAALAERVAELLAAGGFSGLSRRLRSPSLQTASLRLPGARRFWWAYLLAGMGLAALVLRLAAVVAGALDDPLTTLQYGEVRTTHLSVLFGLPGETSTSPSLLTATNDHGIGHIFLLPAGQAKAATVVEIPLTDVDSDGRLPLKLEVADLDRDGHPDLLVTLGNTGTTYVFLLDTGQKGLRPPSEEERRRLILPGQSH